MQGRGKEEHSLGEQRGDRRDDCGLRCAATQQQCRIASSLQSRLERDHTAGKREEGWAWRRPPNLVSLVC